jgi:hypothetical protein
MNILFSLCLCLIYLNGLTQSITIAKPLSIEQATPPGVNVSE